MVLSSTTCFKCPPAPRTLGRGGRCVLSCHRPWPGRVPRTRPPAARRSSRRGASLGGLPGSGVTACGGAGRKQTWRQLKTPPGRVGRFTLGRIIYRRNVGLCCSNHLFQYMTEIKIPCKILAEQIRLKSSVSNLVCYILHNPFKKWLRMRKVDSVKTLIIPGIIMRHAKQRISRIWNLS